MQIMQFLLVGLYPELSSGGNYVEMCYNEEEILMRRQGWKNITQSKRNESVWRQNTNDSNTKTFGYISGFMQRLEILTWRLPGAWGAEFAPLVAIVVRAGSLLSLQTSSLQALLILRSYTRCKWKKNLSLNVISVELLGCYFFGGGQARLLKALNFFFFSYCFPLIVQTYIQGRYYAPIWSFPLFNNSWKLIYFTWIN